MQLAVPLGERVQGAAAELARDNRFRLALADDQSAERLWLLDWASAAMRSAGLTFLQLHDSTGRIAGSGHNRNEHGRLAAAVPGCSVTVRDLPSLTHERRMGAFAAS